MCSPADRLLARTDPFPRRLDAGEAKDIIAAARSSNPRDVDVLLEVAMRKGLRHVRIAVDAIGIQVAQRQQEPAPQADEIGILDRRDFRRRDRRERDRRARAPRGLSGFAGRKKVNMRQPLCLGNASASRGEK